MADAVVAPAIAVSERAMYSQQTTCVRHRMFRAAHRAPARDATPSGKSARQVQRLLVRQLSELFLATKAVVTMSRVWRRSPQNQKNRRHGGGHRAASHPSSARMASRALSRSTTYSTDLITVTEFPLFGLAGNWSAKNSTGCHLPLVLGSPWISIVT